jgi:hypothetical protein
MIVLIGVLSAILLVFKSRMGYLGLFGLGIFGFVTATNNGNCLQSCLFFIVTFTSLYMFCNVEKEEDGENHEFSKR